MGTQVLEMGVGVEDKLRPEKNMVIGTANDQPTHPFILIGKDGVEEITCEKIVYSSSLQYGFGLFETLKIFDNEVLFWHDHYWRMYNSVKHISIPFYWNSLDLLQSIKKSLLSRYSEGTLRLYLFLSPLYGYKNLNSVESKMLCSLLTDKVAPPTNAKLFISNVFRYSSDYLVKHKMTQRAHLILVSKAYQEKGAYEGLLLNENNHITEGTRSNIFFYKNNKFYTPSLDTGILPGVTRKKLIQIIKEKGYEIEEGFYTQNDLLSAEEIFITFTTYGIIPISEIIGADKKFKIEKSLQLQKEFEEKVKKENEYFRVLFVCKENSVRSIMAESIMNKISNGKVKAISAGLKSSQINSMTKKILENESLFSQSLRSKELTKEMLHEVDFVVTVCDISNCVVLGSLDTKTQIIRWEVKEPAGTQESYYNTYKEIENLCGKFLVNLGI